MTLFNHARRQGPRPFDKFYLRVLSDSPMAELETPHPPRGLRTRRVPAAWGSRVVRTAKAKGDTFVITVNWGYDSGGSLELIWNAAHRDRGRSSDLPKYHGR
jgi:hypothetical protein